jgi:hypothetical protein
MAKVDEDNYEFWYLCNFAKWCPKESISLQKRGQARRSTVPIVVCFGSKSIVEYCQLSNA